MARYIDADKLYDDIRKSFNFAWELPCFAEDRIIQDAVCRVYEKIRNQPTADVVEVVRCKDCKHKNPLGYKCLRDNLWHDSDDFCSYGERKKNEK